MAEQKTRVRVIVISILAGALIFGLKAWAFFLTGSAALKSDAIESTVNIVAALFALGAVIFAGKPADRNHPYGHGKIEFFSAAFEGGLISLASVLIIYEAVLAIIHPPELKELNWGLALNLGAGALNGLLGWFLLTMGKKTRSKALEADGHHVLSDFYTTLAIGAGLLLVKATGLTWLDPAMALGVGFLMARAGFKLVKSSADALLDAEDPEMLNKVVDGINQHWPEEIIAVHELRTMRSGRFTHVDVHLVVPEYFEVGRAHDLVEDFAMEIIKKSKMEGEFHTHVDPCYREFCDTCQMKDCPVRKKPFVSRPKMNVELATSPGPEERLIKS